MTGGIPGASGNGSTADTLRLLHELQVHKIELESQFEEVRRSRAEVEQSRARYAELFELAPMGYLAVSRAGFITDANRAAAALLEVEPSALSGTPFLLSVDEADRPALTAALEAVRTDHQRQRLEVQLVGPRDHGGQRVSRHVQIDVAVAAPDGEYLVSLADLTQHRASEHALRQMERALQDAQRMEAIGRLAGGIAHDFNNLLTIINGYAELVCLELGAAHESTHHVADILLAGRRAADLTRQLLTFSRRQVLALTPLDLRALVAGVTEMLRRLIGEHIVLDVHLDTPALFVRGDITQFEQVLLNLATNARDAMADGGTLHIRLEQVMAGPESGPACGHLVPGPYAQLTVTDTGRGMDEATRVRAFEPFFSTKLMGQGTGLGLALAYSVVRQCEGSIDLQSAEGVGSTVRILLPITTPVAPSENRFERTLPPLGGGETILVVEDEAQVRHLATRLLTELGYTVLAAGDGVDALAVASSHDGPIDLLLTDVVMPRMGGRELALRLTSLRPAMRVLFTSGYNDDEVLQRGIERQETPLLEKPYSRDAIGHAVRGILDRTTRPA